MGRIIGVLGATGFVGTNLVKRLTDLGEEVIGSSRSKGVDATDLMSLVAWLRSHNITHLVNLAAICGGIGLNKKRPADLWSASTRIGSTVLEAARRTRLAKTVMIGTVCSYAKYCPVPFKEDDLMHHGEPEPTNLAYGVSKLATLFGARAYAKQYNMNICNLVPVNMYGPNDHFDLENSHVIPAMIRKIHDAQLAGTDLTLWGTGQATREFLYASDFADAVLAALDRLDDPTFVNIGSGSEISIADLVTLIAEIMGYAGRINWDTTMPDGQPRRCLNVDKATALLQWQATTPLRAGLEHTIQWYLANADRIKAEELANSAI